MLFNKKRIVSLYISDLQRFRDTHRHRERMINVDDDDDDDSNFSFKDDLDDPDAVGSPDSTGRSRISPIVSPGPSEEHKSQNNSPKSLALSRDVDNKNGEQKSSSSTNTDSTQTRPKIWSISNFLNSSSASTSSSSSSSVKPEDNKKASACVTKTMPQQNGGSGFYYLPSSKSSMAGGRFGAFGAYPFSLSQNTLSYPYTLTSHPAKAAMLNAASGMAVPENLSVSAEKLMKAQAGIFSPARDIDVVRNGGKY